MVEMYLLQHFVLYDKVVYRTIISNPNQMFSYIYNYN